MNNHLIQQVPHTADCRYGYEVYLPEGYQQDQQYPIVFFLHGAGERGVDEDGRRQSGDDHRRRGEELQLRFVDAQHQARAVPSPDRE